MSRILDHFILDAVSDVNQPLLPIVGPDVSQSGSPAVRLDDPTQNITTRRNWMRAVVDPAPAQIFFSPDDHNRRRALQRSLEVGQDDLSGSTAPGQLLLVIHAGKYCPGPRRLDGALPHGSNGDRRLSAAGEMCRSRGPSSEDEALGNTRRPTIPGGAPRPAFPDTGIQTGPRLSVAPGTNSEA